MYQNQTMNEFEFLLEDRISKIRAINNDYDLEHNSYISFSGGKDSTLLHYLIDIALPNNNIPRVYFNTGLEYKLVRQFVQKLRESDSRIIIVNSGVNIKQMLEKEGYPFKSKQYAHNWQLFRNNPKLHNIYIYMIEKNPKLLEDYNFIHNLPNGVKTNIKFIFGVREKADGTIYRAIESLTCPKRLRYQFTEEFVNRNLNLSDKCCHKLKKEVAHKYEKENNRFIAMTGIRGEEGGMRALNGCTIFDGNNLKKFHPLKVCSDEWVNWFIEKNNIRLCNLYYPPYNYTRTGCKFCPFAIDLQKQLDVAKELLPIEYKQANIIWKPVYDEYRRIGYRLRKRNLLDLLE